MLFDYVIYEFVLFRYPIIIYVQLYTDSDILILQWKDSHLK